MPAKLSHGFPSGRGRISLELVGEPCQLGMEAQAQNIHRWRKQHLGDTREERRHGIVMSHRGPVPVDG